MDNLIWRKARLSSENGDMCVELACVPGKVAIRDSKRPGAGHLTLDGPALRRALTNAARHRDGSSA